MPCSGRASNVAEPEIFGMLPGVGPTGYDSALQVGVHPRWIERDFLKHFLGTPRHLMGSMKPSGCRQQKVFGKYAFLALGGCVDHLADSVPAEGCIEFRS